MNLCSGQGNPGFIGKRRAVGYNIQYSLINSLIDRHKGISFRRFVTNHDFYLEQSISKYKSVSLHLSYQKVTLPNLGLLEDNHQIEQEYNYNGSQFSANGEKTGISDFRYFSAGLKYTIYASNKTIAAPIGLGYYLRLDIHSINAIKNTYNYQLIGENVAQSEYATKNIDRSVNNTRTYNFSLGAGGESKFILSKLMFIRLNAEFNLSSIGIVQAWQNDFDISYSKDIKGDLKLTGQSVNRFRNMFLFGLGVGVLI